MQENENFNHKRSNTISELKRKNKRFVKQMSKEAINMKLSPETQSCIDKLNSKLKYCSNISLYSYCNQWKYICSHTCDSKFCFICNWKRQKTIRRKLLKWFNENHYFIQSNNNKFYTISKAKQNNIHGKQVRYDVMHLVLTVPHYVETGFRGNEFYFKDIQALFDRLRKKPEFKNNVIAGEYGIETTQSSNGLHIHIHSLLLVKSEKQNRNSLHKFILLEWNKLTVNPDSQRESLLDIQDLILKSNKLLSKSDIEKLNPKGTTLITLENIYNWQNSEKTRKFDFGSDKFIQAILECVKYHFEPLCFDKENKEFDYDLVIKLAPKLHRLILYKKIGAWHGETQLNISYKDNTEELEDVLETIDYETGEIFESEYYVINPAYVFHNETNICVSKSGLSYSKKLDATSTKQAMLQLTDLIQNSFKSQKHDMPKQHINKSFNN